MASQSPTIAEAELKGDWVTIDSNPDNVQIIANTDGVWLRHGDGFVYKWTHVPMKWERLDTNRETVDLVAIHDTAFQRLNNGDVLQLYPGGPTGLDWQVVGTGAAKIWDSGLTICMLSTTNRLYYYHKIESGSWHEFQTNVETPGFAAAVGGNAVRVSFLLLQAGLRGATGPQRTTPLPERPVQIELSSKIAYILWSTGRISQNDLEGIVPTFFIQNEDPEAVSIVASLGHVYQLRKSGYIIVRTTEVNAKWIVMAPPSGGATLSMSADPAFDKFYQIRTDGYAFMTEGF